MSALYALLTIATVMTGILFLPRNNATEIWARIDLFIFPNVQSVVLAVLLLLFYLNGGYRKTALIVFDAVTTDADDKNADRYRSGTNLLSRVSRQLYLWGGILFVYALVLLLANIHAPRHIGPVLGFVLIGMWSLLMVRIIIIIPMQLSLHRKLSFLENTVLAENSRSGRKAIVPGRTAAVVLLIGLLPAMLLSFNNPRTDPFFDPGLLMLLFGTIVFPAWMGVGFRDFFRMTAAAANAGENRYRSKILHSFGILSIEAGAAAFIIKVIFLLQDISAPSTIPYELSTSIAPLFFGMLIAGAVFFPLSGYLRRSPDE
jgi:flagellar motor component MotA